MRDESTGVPSVHAHTADDLPEKIGAIRLKATWRNGLDVEPPAGCIESINGLRRTKRNQDFQRVRFTVRAELRPIILSDRVRIGTP